MEISAGYIHALARRTDGSVVGWGSNNYGQSALQARNDFQAISGGLYWSLSMVGTSEDIFADDFESGDTLNWTETSP